jgi:hypothetical protein
MAWLLHAPPLATFLNPDLTGDRLNVAPRPLVTA